MVQQLWRQLTAQLEQKIRSDDERYQRANKMAWALNAALVRAEMARDDDGDGGGGDDAASKEEAALDELARETVLSPDTYNNIVHGTYLQAKGGGGQGRVHQRAPRICNISSKMEDYARYKAFRHFLSDESLLSPDAPCFVTLDGENQRHIITDEEYLGGACIGLCHELAKYGVTRASNAADDKAVVPFIKRARDAVSLILEELLQFDFRNGPLRRKYDSTKYALKTLETVLYELSVAGAVGGHEGLVFNGSNGIDEGGPVKKIKIDGSSDRKTDYVTMKEEGGMSPGIPQNEIAAIRERMDHRDKLRERLIKTCRDGQKAAKQAIFAMHRGDAVRAGRLLGDCEKCIRNNLLPILEEEPTLRSGTFAGVLEEYAEGRLFYAWLYGDGGGPANGGRRNEKAVGRILLPNEMPLKISMDDYVGGLCDLTGEIGRFAVARGTARDKESVKLCLDSNKAVHMTLRMLGKPPKGASKKAGMVSKGVEKLERVLYEQSLMEMTGRRDFSSSVEEGPGYPNDVGGDEG